MSLAWRQKAARPRWLWGQVQPNYGPLRTSRALHSWEPWYCLFLTTPNKSYFPVTHTKRQSVVLNYILCLCTCFLYILTQPFSFQMDLFCRHLDGTFSGKLFLSSKSRVCLLLCRGYGSAVSADPISV